VDDDLVGAARPESMKDILRSDGVMRNSRLVMHYPAP